LSEDENWSHYEEGIFYKKGQTAQITLADGLVRRFKVKKPFKLHGWKDGRVVVTIPINLGTLRGLGFIGSIKYVGRRAES